MPAGWPTGGCACRCCSKTAARDRLDGQGCLADRVAAGPAQQHAEADMGMLECGAGAAAAKKVWRQTALMERRLSPVIEQQYLNFALGPCIEHGLHDAKDHLEKARSVDDAGAPQHFWIVVLVHGQHLAHGLFYVPRQVLHAHPCTRTAACQCLLHGVPALAA